MDILSERKNIESVINMKTEYFPFAIYGIIRDFAKALIELEGEIQNLKDKGNIDK